jgi:hypothetical protein
MQFPFVVLDQKGPSPTAAVSVRAGFKCHRIIGVVSVFSKYNCVYYCDTPTWILC